MGEPVGPWRPEHGLAGKLSKLAPQRKAFEPWRAVADSSRALPVERLFRRRAMACRLRVHRVASSYASGKVI